MIRTKYTSHLTSNSTNNNFLRVLAIRSTGYTKIVLFNYRYWKKYRVQHGSNMMLSHVTAPANARQNHSVCLLIAQCTIFSLRGPENMEI